MTFLELRWGGDRVMSRSPGSESLDNLIQMLYVDVEYHVGQVEILQ